MHKVQWFCLHSHRNNNMFTVYSISNLAGTGHDTGDKTIHVGWFVDGLGVHHDDIDVFCALDHSV